MDSFFKGDFGQYFTPREVVAFVCSTLNPKAHEKVIDPACGSGGFLLAALDKVRRDATEFYPADTDERALHWHRFAERNLFGIEVNEEITRVAKMNMILHEDGHTNVISLDSLSNLDRIANYHKGFGREQFDVVLTNPPFGSQVALSEHPYLEEYDLARNQGTGKVRRSQKSEVLFVERIFEFLRPGGRAGIVVPDGILSNSSLQYVRDYLFERFQVLAIVSLPTYTFFQYGASVKSSILIVRKRLTGEAPSDLEEVFLAAPESIGYDATGHETTNDLLDLGTELRAFLKSVTGF
jgi:type I restriction enzyme M protein